MRPSYRSIMLGLLCALGVLAACAPARADNALQVVSSDATGITLRLDLPALEISPPDRQGRSRVAAAGLDPLGGPGRPSLPAAAALIALPPGARATAHVIQSGPEDVRTGIKLVVGGKPGLRDDGGKMGAVQVVDPVAPLADGPWPAASVELGEPFGMRRMRVVAVRVRPLRYDEASGTLWSRRSLTVRVDFQGVDTAKLRSAASLPIEDRNWDAVLQQGVLNFDAARAWRGAVAPVTTTALERARRSGTFAARAGAGIAGTAAFDEDNPEVRCVIDTTGLFALTFASLSANGFPAGIAVSQLSVHRHEFVPGANPAYVTIELPIEVDDRDADGTFNGTDRILVFTQNWNEREHPSIAQRAWGDAEVVYATYLTGRSGLRLAARPGWSDPPLAPLVSYRTTQHYEKTGFYINVFNLGLPPFLPAESDTNTDQFVWTGLGLYDRNDPAFPGNFPFETNDLDTARPVNVAVQWVGLRASPPSGGSASHIVYAEVKNAANQWTTIVDSLQFQGRRTVTARAQVPASAIANGKNNTLRTFGRTVGITGNVLNAGLNWFEINYARRFKAIQGRLSCNSDSVSGPFQITATGFTTRNIRVWDVTDSLAPVRLSLADTLISSTAPYSVRFQDSSPTGAIRRYVAFDTPTALPAAKFAAVARRNLAGSGIADDLIITPELLLESATRLGAHRATQNLRVLVCPLESIDDEFNGGRKSSYSIRRLLQYVYTAWGTRFVTLLGDGSEDPQNLTGTAGPDLLPVQKIAGPVGIGEGSVTVYESVVSDPWYVWCLDGNCSSNGPFLQDMFIGRLPVGTPAQAAGVVDKLIKYDDVQPDQAWRRKIMLCADDQFSTQSFFGGSPTGGPSYCFKPEEGAFLALNTQTRYLLETEGGYQDADIEMFDLGDYLSSVQTYEDPQLGTCRVDWHATQDWCHINVTPQLFQHLTEGRVWWNFEGHANPYVLTHEDLYKNLGSLDDLGLFNNVDKPFLFSAFSCHPNAFGVVTENDRLGPALGEDMVNLAGKGAIASWASSAYELLPYDYFNHITEHLARSLFTDPPRDAYLGQGGARVLLGESIALALARNAAVHSGWEADVGITYQLLGDPATRLSIGAPLSVVTANALPVTSGDPVRLHTVGDTLRLEADLVSNVRLASLALDRTVSGVTATLPASAYTLTPAFTDSGAASMGGRRFHLTYRTPLTPESYTFTFRTSDRYNVAGRFDAVFPLQSVLRADGAPVGEGEPVTPNAVLTLLLLSPAPLTLPGGLNVTLNNVPMSYTWTPANGDTTGREWTLGLPHADFATGDYQLEASAVGGGKTTHVFTVEPGSDRVSLRNTLAFPNPFDETRGTYFSFRLVSPIPADVQIRVYTVTGRLIYKQDFNGLAPGYHQYGWDGIDSDGSGIANGLYLYRIIATNGATTDRYDGRLIKLRRPRRAAEPAASGSTP